MIDLKTFQTIVASLRCEATSDAFPDAERLAAPRQRCECDATLILLDPKKNGSFRIRVLDISFGGVSMRYAKPLRPGELFILVTTHPQTSERTAILCSVTHTRSLAPSSYSIGASFVRRLVVEGNGAVLRAGDNVDVMFKDATFASPPAEDSHD